MRTKRGEKFLLCDFAEVLVIRGEEQLREGAISYQRTRSGNARAQVLGVLVVGRYGPCVVHS